MKVKIIFQGVAGISPCLRVGRLGIKPTYDHKLPGVRPLDNGVSGNGHSIHQSWTFKFFLFSFFVSFVVIYVGGDSPLPGPLRILALGHPSGESETIRI